MQLYSAVFPGLNRTKLNKSLFYKIVNCKRKFQCHVIYSYTVGCTKIFYLGFDGSSWSHSMQSSRGPLLQRVLDIFIVIISTLPDSQKLSKMFPLFKFRERVSDQISSRFSGNNSSVASFTGTKPVFYLVVIVCWFSTLLRFLKCMVYTI